MLDKKNQKKLEKILEHQWRNDKHSCLLKYGETIDEYRRRKKMGKFIVHGTLLEEPTRTTLKSGIDCVRILVEERYNTVSKEVVNHYQIDFLGKNASLVPENSVIGAPVVIYGSISTNTYNGRYYNDLKGEQITVLSNRSVDSGELSNSQENEVKGTNLNQIEIDDDDLPF